MGYWLTTGLQYYEGDQQAATDTAVDQRPYPTMDWTAGAWVYDLAATRIRVKNIYNDALNNDIMSLFSSNTDPSSLFISVMYVALFADAVSYTDSAANNSPLYDGYLAVSGLANKAAVHAAIKNEYDIVGVSFGKLLARRDADYALIDAAATGPDIIAVVYVRPF